MKLLQSIIVPHEIVNDEFVTVIQCHYKSGDRVKEGDALVLIETSKMTEELYAGCGGYVYYRCQADAEIKVGERILEIYEQPVSSASVPPQKIPEKNEALSNGGEAVFSQSALRLIEELKMSKDLFKGRDLVGTEDVRSFQLQPGPTVSDQLESAENIEFQKISPYKKREIEYLNDVQSSHLSNTVSMLVEVGSCLAELNRVSKFFRNSLLLIVLSKLPSLLKEYPELNAFYKAGSVGFYENTALGLAVNFGDGLRVLKLPETGEKSITDVEVLVFDMIKRYMGKKLTSKDVAGVTFTVTDLSKEGIHFFAPLIPKGQSAILGISAIDEKLQRCILSLSFDHRVTDGRKASEFLRKLKKRIEGR